MDAQMADDDFAAALRAYTNAEEAAQQTAVAPSSVPAEEDISLLGNYNIDVDIDGAPPSLFNTQPEEMDQEVGGPQEGFQQNGASELMSDFADSGFPQHNSRGLENNAAPQSQMAADSSSSSSSSQHQPVNRPPINGLQDIFSQDVTPPTLPAPP